MVIKAQVFAQSERVATARAGLEALLQCFARRHHFHPRDVIINYLGSAISPSAASTCQQVYLLRDGAYPLSAHPCRCRNNFACKSQYAHSIHYMCECASECVHVRPLTNSQRASVYLCTHVCALQTNTHLEPPGCVSSSILCEMCALLAYPMAS